MKTTLKDLKDLIRKFKTTECPKLSSSKMVLHEFASKHGLIKKEEPSPVLEKKAEPVMKAVKKKVEVPVAPPMSKKDSHKDTLKKVMEIRKSGKTLKEAWAEVKK